jgi:hypothetical protein
MLKLREIASDLQIAPRLRADEGNARIAAKPFSLFIAAIYHLPPTVVANNQPNVCFRVVY